MARRSLEEAEREIAEAWQTLGSTEEEANDDPDVATLSAAISVSLEYEREIAARWRDAAEAAEAGLARLQARDYAIVEVTREHCKNVVQARSGWGAARDLDMLDVRTIFAEAEKKLTTGILPPKRPAVSDWRDEIRQALTVIMSTAETIKNFTEPGIGPDLTESCAAMERNVDRLDHSLRVLDAALNIKVGRRTWGNADILRVATFVRDQCRHAAICAPVHREEPDAVIDLIDLETIIKQALGDDWGSE